MPISLMFNNKTDTVVRSDTYKNMSLSDAVELINEHTLVDLKEVF